MATPTFAQRHEVGIALGTSSYLGDINPSALFSQPQLAAGLLYRYDFNTRWSLRASATYCKLTADDANHNNSRNLNFRTNIYEVAAVAEVNFLTFFTGSKYLYRFSPFLFGGIGLFHFNPQARYFDVQQGKDVWVDLRPLSTEGQNQPEYPDRKYYSRVQPCIPFGLGFKYSINSRLTLTAEFGMKKTFTDYIDDCSTTYIDPAILRAYVSVLAADLADRSDIPNSIGSQRGNSNTTDWYTFAGLTLTYKILPNRNYRCPAYPKQLKVKP